MFKGVAMELLQIILFHSYVHRQQKTLSALILIYQQKSSIMFMQNMIIRDGEYTKAIFTLVSPQTIL